MSTLAQCAGKFGICNHLAKLGLVLTLTPNPRRTKKPGAEPDFFVRRCFMAGRLLLIMIMVVAGGVFFLVFATANEAPAYHAGGSPNYGTFAAAQ